MNRVLRAPKQEVPLPTADLIQLMVFEDQDDAEEFIEYCGLQVDGNLIMIRVYLDLTVWFVYLTVD